MDGQPRRCGVFLGVPGRGSCETCTGVVVVEMSDTAAPVIIDACGRREPHACSRCSGTGAVAVGEEGEETRCGFASRPVGTVTAIRIRFPRRGPSLNWSSRPSLRVLP
ncbi:hypothetical protein MRX96_013289 [Rhipicephalus microplus]